MAVDDLILTLSDADDISDEESGEEEVSPPPAVNGAKRKRETKEQSAVKKQKSEDNEDVFSDFEFEAGGGSAALDDLTGWALSNKPQSSSTGKQDVDIDAIVARRRPTKSQPKDESEDEPDEDLDDFEEDSAGEESEEDADGVALEESDEEAAENSDEASQDELDNDGDDVAAPVPHPDDQVSEPGSDDEEDAIEEEKRNAFFANDADSKHPSSTATAFHSLNLSRPILKGLTAVGFSKPTPIQAKTIPVALEGKDLVGGAVTGSGKTAAFLIPILERLLFRPKRNPTTRVVILMPTRELALQCFNVATKLASFTDITFGQAIGGLNLREQEKQLKLRPDIVIATPGRFIDLERNSSAFAVHTIEILVLDEADRMLEEGFADELNEILTKIPKSRQTMLFSATMTSKVDDLIRVGLQRPVRLMVDAQRQTVAGLVQEFVRLRPGREGKRLAYLMHLCSDVYTQRVIVFFRQKKDAHRTRVLFALCGLRAAELHGSMSQEQRLAAVDAFRTGAAAFLLATDLASRGLDIKGIATVLNYEAPQTHDIYLHRVGRTARAGASGRACTLAAEPDRRVVKAAVKAGKAHGARILQRAVAADVADAWHARLAALDDEVEAVLREEKEERALAQVDRELARADNIAKHAAEIHARPRRTWFESEKDKQAARERGVNALNGVTEAEAAAKKEKRKLSNKQKKRLQDRDDRKAGKEWKKGKSDRAQGKQNKVVKGTKPKAKGKR